MIKTATFVKSSAKLEQCPPPDRPEFAFVGRSNVGKSSLINYLTNHSKLAKTSGEPGKTQTLNHFLINNEWYLVDLPGYGYAKVSQKLREEWLGLMKQYLKGRENLLYTFVLIDSRLEPQKNDIEFINWMGSNGLPFCIVFTKTDKNGLVRNQTMMGEYEGELLKYWDELPPMFLTSSEKKLGGEKILDFIRESIKLYA